MDGTQASVRLENRVSTVLQQFSSKGIEIGSIRNARYRMLNGDFETRCFMKITGVFAIPGIVPYTGPTTPALLPFNQSLCRLGVNLAYQFAATYNEETHDFECHEIIVDERDPDAFAVIEPGDDVVSMVKKSSLFTNKGEMGRYTTYAVVRNLFDEQTNCILYLENNDWVVSCDPKNGLRVTAKLRFADVQVDAGEFIHTYHGLVCDLAVNGNLVDFIEFEQVSPYGCVFVPSNLRGRMGGFTPAVVGTCAHGDKFGAEIAQKILGYLRNERLHERLPGT